MSTTKKPVCQTVLPWLKNNLGKHCLGGLTSQDAKALAAAVQLVELYAYDRHPSVINAWAATVRRMQPHMQPLAYHATAHVLDWPARADLWVAAGLPEIPVGVCAFEPAARNAAVRAA